VGDDDDRPIQRVDATPPVRDVEQPPTDNEHTDPVHKVLQVRVIRRRQRKRDLGVSAREFDIPGAIPRGQVLEAGLLRPGDVPVQLDAGTGDDLAHLILPDRSGRCVDDPTTANPSALEPPGSDA
jgi:hypothetical protein